MINWRQGYPKNYATVIPNLQITQTDSCGTVIITEDSYLSNNNYADLTSAVVTINDNSGTEVYSEDILSSLISSLTGTADITVGTGSIVGTASLFTTELTTSDYLLIDDTNEVIKISSIADNTNLVLETWSVGATGSDIYKITPNITLLNGTSNLSLSDGRYDVEYVLTVGATSYTSNLTYFCICNIECCVLNKVAAIPNYYASNGCSSPYIQNTMTIYSLYLALKTQIAYCNWSAAATTLALLQKLCDYNDCNC